MSGCASDGLVLAASMIEEIESLSPRIAPLRGLYSDGEVERRQALSQEGEVPGGLRLRPSWIIPTEMLPFVLAQLHISTHVIFPGVLQFLAPAVERNPANA